MPQFPHGKMGTVIPQSQLKTGREGTNRVGFCWEHHAPSLAGLPAPPPGREGGRKEAADD